MPETIKTHLKAKTNFSWAFRGCDVVEFKEGEDIDTDDQDLVDVATAEGWADEIGEDGKPIKRPTKAEAKKAA